MRQSNPLDPINQAICDQLLLNKPVRKIARFIKPRSKYYHKEVLRRIRNVLIPCGLVYETTSGVYSVNRELYEASKQVGVIKKGGRENQKSKGIKGSGKKRSLGGGSHDPTPLSGHARIHAVSLFINLKKPLSTIKRDKIKKIPSRYLTLWGCDQPMLYQVNNWSKVEVVFRNFRAYLTPNGVYIYGIQAFGDMHTPTMGVFDKGIQFTLPDFTRLENLLSAATSEKVRLEKGNDGKVVISQVSTIEVAHTNDPGAKRMLLGRSYMVIRDVDGRIRFKLDRSEGPEELEGTGHNAIEDMDNIREFRLRVGDEEYARIMNYVGDGKDLIGEVKRTIKTLEEHKTRFSGQDEILKQLSNSISLIAESLQQLASLSVSQRDNSSPDTEQWDRIDFKKAYDNMHRGLN